jgi:threonine dehydrogenase-like Zn-dependent dehydrogenase
MHLPLKARAFWIAAPGRGELREEEIPRPGEGEALVRTTASGISRGTEALVFECRVPPSQFETMRAPFQEGAFPAPVKYGYAAVGVVEDGPLSWRGRRVFALHPHQDRFVVPIEALHAVPDGVPDARAVLAANMETALNALWDARPALGDRIAVVGAGTVGALVGALAAALPGVAVELVDVDPERAALAAALGCGFALPERAAAEADLVVHASGTEAGLATALRLAGFEATVLELSWYGDRRVAAPLGEAFHSKRLVLRASQVGHVPAARRARWSRARRLALALDLLRDGRFDRLLSGESRFEDLPARMAQLAHSPAGTLCHVVRYAP